MLPAIPHPHSGTGGVRGLKAVQRLLWWIIAGSKGGVNRKRIIEVLHDTPMNMNQLAAELGLDYTTIRHHIKVLMKNNLVVTQGKGYGALYFTSDMLEENYDEFLKISERIGKKNKTAGRGGSDNEQ